MRQTTITVQRNNATIFQRVPVQIENMSPYIHAELKGQSDYFGFWVYLTGGSGYDIRFRDLLLDESQIDYLTNKAAQYRVFGRPETYDGGYMEIPTEQIIGS